MTDRTGPGAGRRIAVMATTSRTIAAFYRQPLVALRDAGIDVCVCCAPDTDLSDVLPAQIRFFPAGLTRTSTPFTDLRTLWRLYRWIRRERFDLVQYSTPKAALLGALAATLARVPNRLYLIWGLYYEGQVGLRRRLFMLMEKLICRLSTQIVPNSRGSLDTLVNDGIVRRSKCVLVRHGSPCGIDTEEFEPGKWASAGSQLRRQAGIPADALVIGVLGRLTGDKGVNEIVAAFGEIAPRNESAHLLIVGDQEEKDRLRPETEELIQSHPRIRHVERQSSVCPFYAAIDIFALLSYREGLPQSVLEAQAMERPVVCTDIPGCREAIDPERTGMLVRPRNTTALIEPLERLIEDGDLRRRMGAAGRKWIELRFAAKDVVAAMLEHRLTALRRRPPRRCD